MSFLCQPQQNFNFLRFPLLENTTFVRTILPLAVNTGVFVFPKKISLIFQSPLQPPILPQHWLQTSIYPLYQRLSCLLVISCFWSSMPDICVTIFMVFCCCSTDIILNRFPGWENDRFPSNYDRTSLQNGY
jgi:hypothetical protein